MAFCCEHKDEQGSGFEQIHIFLLAHIHNYIPNTSAPDCTHQQRLFLSQDGGIQLIISIAGGHLIGHGQTENPFSTLTELQLSRCIDTEKFVNLAKAILA